MIPTSLDQETIRKLFVSIPAGTVEMRDDRIEKVWTAEIKSFQLFQTPVTQGLYELLIGENPSTFKGEQLPVETVSWVDAVHFCNVLSDFLELERCYVIDPNAQKVIFHGHASGVRLPTEAEWQYACQVGGKEIRYAALNDIAWYKENSNGQPQSVGQKEPNKWGLYDMLGNVWEWCTDVYDETVYGSYRIFRGAGWSDMERSVMATTRRRSHPFAFKIDDLGFRIAINYPTNP